jgi:Isopenicillin N synthase and related dioxygenases
MSNDVPVLDLGRFDGAPAEREAFLADLRRAGYELGGFYLSGHGVDPGLIGQLHGLSRRFFDLPEADKLAIEMARSPHFRGYTRVGWERTRGAADWREQIDVGSERPVLAVDNGDPAWRRLQGPNQWPDALPELRPALLRLQAELTRVGLKLARAVAAALGQPEDAFDAILSDSPNQLIKLIRYPGRPEGEDRQGVGPHKDSGFLTFVLQTDQSGLQLETPGGWVDLEPIPGTFVVNVSELLELASDGYFRANVHQVVSPPAHTDRLSIAFFLGARLDARVPVLDLPPELKSLARGPERDPANPLFYDVGENYLKGRLRSHPDVAERHYADLLQARSA